MYAIIKDGPKQYRVEKGVELEFDRREAKAGDKVEFTEVLVLGDGETVKLGTPTVAGAKVVGEVIGEVKDKKVIAFKYRRREGYHRTVGHRQKYTVVKITDIVTA